MIRMLCLLIVCLILFLSIGHVSAIDKSWTMYKLPKEFSKEIVQTYCFETLSEYRQKNNETVNPTDKYKLLIDKSYKIYLVEYYALRWWTDKGIEKQMSRIDSNESCFRYVIPVEVNGVNMGVLIGNNPNNPWWIENYYRYDETPWLAPFKDETTLSKIVKTHNAGVINNVVIYNETLHGQPSFIYLDCSNGKYCLYETGDTLTWLTFEKFVDMRCSYENAHPGPYGKDGYLSTPEEPSYPFNANLTGNSQTTTNEDNNTSTVSRTTEDESTTEINSSSEKQTTSDSDSVKNFVDTFKTHHLWWVVIPAFAFCGVIAIIFLSKRKK